MKVSNYVLDKRLRALESSQRHSQRLQEELDSIDIRTLTAEPYWAIHEDICDQGHEFYNLRGGRGSGKSSFCALEIPLQIMRDPTGLSNALVVRKWAVTLRGSVYAQIQWALNALGVEDQWRSTLNPLQFVYLPTGQVIRLTGLDDPQKLKSIKPARGYFRYLWCEEFNEINGELELRNLQQSVLRGGDSFTVLRSFNPPISRVNWANEYCDRPDDRSLNLLTNYTQIPLEWLGQTFIDEAEKLREINPRAYDHEYMGLAVGQGAEVFETLQGRLRGEADAHHAVAHELDIALVRQFFGTAVGEVEHGGGLTGLEVQLYLVFADFVAQLEGELSEGIVGVVPEAHGVAAGGLLDAARQRGPFGLKASLVGLLLLAELEGHQFAQMTEICADVHHGCRLFGLQKYEKKYFLYLCKFK